MRTLIVTHYFPPEIGAPQARLSEMARSWAAEGDDVTVLTGMPNHPTGVIPPRYRRRLLMTENVDSYRVVRTWLYATPNEGIIKKTLGHVSFMLSSVLLGLRKVGRPDVVVVSSPTFFSIWAGWVIAKIRGARFVVEIRDLWPAIFVELGVLTNRHVIRMLEIAELTAYRWADAVIVVSEGFRENLIERGVPSSKVNTIRNGVDLERFDPTGVTVDERDAARGRLGADADDTLVLYIGAHGISHGLSSVADAAVEFQHKDATVRFAFVGDGAAKAELERHVSELQLDNVTMLPGVPREEVPVLLAAADICLVPLRDVALFTTFIPSKIFEYLAAEKAVIGAVRGESAEILREAHAVVVEPESPGELADAIRTLADDAGTRDEMGRLGRAYVEAEFDRNRLARRYRAILASLVNAGPEAGAAGSADRSLS